MLLAVVGCCNIIGTNSKLVLGVGAGYFECAIFDGYAVITILGVVLLKLVANLFEAVGAGSGCLLAAGELPLGLIAADPSIAFNNLNLGLFKLVACMCLAVVFPASILRLKLYSALIDGKLAGNGLNGELVCYNVAFVICYYGCSCNLDVSAVRYMLSCLFG